MAWGLNDAIYYVDVVLLACVVIYFQQAYFFTHEYLLSSLIAQKVFIITGLEQTSWGWGCKFLFSPESCRGDVKCFVLFQYAVPTPCMCIAWSCSLARLLSGSLYIHMWDRIFCTLWEGGMVFLMGWVGGGFERRDCLLGVLSAGDSCWSVRYLPV